MPHPTLLDIGIDAYTHQMEMDELRQRLNITHHYFDCWLYGFLENKHFNVDEAVEKVRRRHAFEREQLAQHTVTEWMLESLQAGIIQVIGNDKAGRVVFYVTTSRDRPEAHQRGEKTSTFDMMVSYGTRLRADSKRCQMALLINQEKASLWKNVDMTFQANIALRIAKFYPGCIDKIYICNMNSMLAAMAKPIFAQFPPIVSERIVIISDKEKKSGKLLELIDDDVLPVALGGKNNCDTQENYTHFSVTIRDYYEQLRHAVLQRGMTVKEWELESLFPHGFPEQSRISADQLGCTTLKQFDHDYDEVRLNDESCCSMNDLRTDSFDLLTCDTFFPCECRSSCDVVASKLTVGVRDFWEDYVDQYLVLETMCRMNISEMFDREWLSILQREDLGRRLLLDAERNYRGNLLLSYGIPQPLRIISNGVVWLSLMVMAIYFLLATVLSALYGFCCMTLFFFSMFSNPFNVFRYGCSLLLLGFQLALFCTRGFELTHRIYNGMLIDALKGFGYKALFVQVVLCCSITLGLFVFFCVMASYYGLLTGLQYSVLAGWGTALFITLLYHILYAFGVADAGRRKGRTTGVAALYFFLDVDMDENQVPARHSLLLELTLPFIAVLISISSGVTSILLDSVMSLAISVVSTGLVALLVVLLVDVSHTVATGGLIISATLYICVAWVDILITIASHSWNSLWGISASLAFCLSLLTVAIVLGYLLTPLKRNRLRRWLFRASWLWVIAHLITCVVLMFVIDYRLGLFNLALGIHLLLYRFCVNEGTSTVGMLIVVTGFLLVLLSCIVMGRNSSRMGYSTPASNLQPRVYNANHTVTRAQEPFAPPVCQIRFPDGLEVLDLAFFAIISDANTFEATLADLHEWLPEFTYVGNHTFFKSFVQLKIFKLVKERFTTTVITLGSSPDFYARSESMMMWVDALFLSLFSIITPLHVFPQLISFHSTVDNFGSLLWTSTIKQVQEKVNAYFLSQSSTSNYVYLVGHGVSGAAASLLEIDNLTDVATVTFTSPVNAAVWRYAGRHNFDVLSRYKLSVVPSSKTFSPWWIWGPLTEIVPCHTSYRNCLNMEDVLRQLQGICRTSERIA